MHVRSLVLDGFAFVRGGAKRRGPPAAAAGSSSGSDGVGLIDKCWRGMPHDMNIMLHELEAAHFALFLGMTLYFLVVLITLYIITCAAQFIARAISHARNSGAQCADAPAPAQVPLRGDRQGGSDGGARERP